MRKNLKKIALFLPAILITAAICFFVWAKMIYTTEPEKAAVANNEQTNDYRITEKPDYWEITPNNADINSNKYQDAALIFYPGAKVESPAYFYKLSGLSNGQAGKLKIFITKPTLNLAIFGINQADEVIKAHPEIKKWIIGGHSLGGAMSCEYAKNHPEKISELWLFASYCGSDISQTNLKVISLHGSLDGVLTAQKLAENRKNLPATAVDFEIEGMNHAQFGNYGAQSGDNAPTKSDEAVRGELNGFFSKLLSQ
jgi:dienelactone hydrolase